MSKKPHPKQPAINAALLALEGASERQLRIGLDNLAAELGGDGEEIFLRLAFAADKIRASAAFKHTPAADLYAKQAIEHIAHSRPRYTTEGGERDERLRTTD